LFYLTIIVLVAAAGILKLWIIQRRERADAGAIDGFRDSLKRLSEPEGFAQARKHVSPPDSEAEDVLDDARPAASRRGMAARGRRAGVSV
jgi:hypothetical protein